jgi:hypothetical protein
VNSGDKVRIKENSKTGVIINSIQFAAKKLFNIKIDGQDVVIPYYINEIELVATTNNIPTLGPKFKIGDKIKITNVQPHNIQYYQNGELGKVTWVSFNGTSAQVEFLNGKSFSVDVNEMELDSHGTITIPNNISNTISNNLGGFVPTSWSGTFAGMYGMDPGGDSYTTNWESEITKTKSCECGVTKTYGASAQNELHSSWCPVRKA